MGEKDLIVVVSGKDLFGKNGEHFFTGFRAAREFDYEARVLENLGFMTRGNSTSETRGFAEQDTNYKQPIAYTAIINPATGKVFVYQRASKDKDYGEKKLQGRISLGIGGHIEMKDITPGGNPIRASLERELLEEEVEFVDGRLKGLDVLGYLYVDSGVNAVHFGMLYTARTNANLIKPKDPEIEWGKLMSLGELDKLAAEPQITVEDWSRVALPEIRKLITH